MVGSSVPALRQTAGVTLRPVPRSEQATDPENPTLAAAPSTWQFAAMAKTSLAFCTHDYFTQRLFPFLTRHHVNVSTWLYAYNFQFMWYFGTQYRLEEQSWDLELVVAICITARQFLRWVQRRGSVGDVPVQEYQKTYSQRKALSSQKKLPKAFFVRPE